MERERRLGLVGLVTVSCGVVAAAGIARLDGSDDVRPLPAALGDLSRARTVEVKDAEGRVVLEGTFGAEEADEDGGRERKAVLGAKGGPGQGEAEIEVVSGGSAPRVELEIEVEALAAGRPFTVYVDGQEAATLTTDSGGDAEVELSSGGRP
jgi:hypothetical protein